MTVCGVTAMEEEELLRSKFEACQKCRQRPGYSIRMIGRTEHGSLYEVRDEDGVLLIQVLDNQSCLRSQLDSSHSDDPR